MRKIIHIDMDAFYASVEMRDRPELRDVPMAVGGQSDRRGVLCTANYEARKYGVRGAMPTKTALKLCPKLVIVRPNFEKYSLASAQVREIFQEFTDHIEPLSLDEAYLDVTDCEQFNNSATLIAAEIRRRIFEKTGLTASAGIASNKLLAKLASDFKKPNGQFTCAPEKVDELIKTIPVGKIWGVGKVMNERLAQMNIKTCGELQAYSRYDLIHLFGKMGDLLFDFCRGIDEREVETDFERKSLSLEQTFERDLESVEEIKPLFTEMVEEVKEALEDYHDRTIKNLYVKIKYFDFQSKTIERQLPLETNNFWDLFLEKWSQDPRPLRLIGVGVKFQSTETEDCGQLQLNV